MDPQDKNAERMSERDRLRSLNGLEWPAAVGAIWDENRSRFADSWDNLSHHNQVSIYRLLTR